MSERDVIERMIDACFDAGQTKYGNPLGSHAGMSAAARVLLDWLAEQKTPAPWGDDEMVDVFSSEALERCARSISINLSNTGINKGI